MTFAQDLSSARKPELLLHIKHFINQPVLIAVPIGIYACRLIFFFFLYVSGLQSFSWPGVSQEQVAEFFLCSSDRFYFLYLFLLPWSVDFQSQVWFSSHLSHHYRHWYTFPKFRLNGILFSLSGIRFSPKTHLTEGKNTQTHMYTCT